ncbi:MAG TPA: SBBP repeat-containing protein [Acidimicrobiia bacterium]|nr:SBBP repeat-containing protein [Acidimicrobiia bacterium]
MGLLGLLLAMTGLIGPAVEGIPVLSFADSERPDLERRPEPGLGFVAEAGDTARFTARSSGYTLSFGPDGMNMELLGPDGPVALHMGLIGANSHPTMVAMEELSGKINFLIGDDPALWRIGLTRFGRLEYSEVYPGIDLAFYGDQGSLKYDFLVAPHVDPGAIAMTLEGARSLKLTPAGELLLHTEAGPVVHAPPVAYQEIGGWNRTVEAAYLLVPGGGISFRLGSYDPALPLVIDPAVEYSVELEGGANEEGHAIAVDAAGNAYVAGFTGSENFPTSGALQPAKSGLYDAFITKLDPTGAVVWSTFFGGSGDERAHGIALDDDGNVIVMGRTDSDDLPTVNASQASFGGGIDAFVAKLTPNGSGLVYSTYLGGSGDEAGSSVDFLATREGAVTVDATGNALITSFTNSTDFPTLNPLQSTLKGGLDVFVTKLDPSGSPIFSTYLGGSSGEVAGGIAVDSQGDVYLNGGTSSSDFPVTAGAFQTVYAGASDAFVAKLASDGSGLVYATYLGGNDGDGGIRIAIDGEGSAYAIGGAGFNFPTTEGSLQPTKPGDFDGYVAKFTPNGSALVYSTYLGGLSNDFVKDVAVNEAGQAYVVGQSESGGTVPEVNVLEDCSAAPEAYIAKLSADGSTAIYATCLGTNMGRIANAVALDGLGGAYLTGWDLGVTGVDASDVAVVKIVDAEPGTADLAVSQTDSPDPVAAGEDVTYTVKVVNHGLDDATSVTLDDQLPDAVTLRSVETTQGTCSGISSCSVTSGRSPPGRWSRSPSRSARLPPLLLPWSTPPPSPRAQPTRTPPTTPRRRRPRSPPRPPRCTSRTSR